MLNDWNGLNGWSKLDHTFHGQIKSAGGRQSESNCVCLVQPKSKDKALTLEVRTTRVDVSAKLVLDSFALLSLYHREPGWQVVQKALRSRQGTDAQL